MEKRNLNIHWALVTLITLGAIAAGGCSSSHTGSGDGDSNQANGDAAGATGTGGTSGSGSSGSGSMQAGDQPGAPGQDPTFVASFPGAGTSGDDAPLMNGELCDYVPQSGDFPTADEVTQCFFDKNGDPVPAATLEQVLECVDGQDVVHLRLTFNPDFVDNTYGTGSIGWPAKRGHWFKDLVKSDHAELLIQDGNGDVVLQFKLDYISEDSSEPSGYGTLGVSGGDGSVSIGDAAWVLDTSTSLDRNLNERGYGSYTTDSPATDENFSPNPDTPEWDYRMVYEAWIDVAALGDNGFGGAFIEYVHASPSKGSSDTIEVEPGECPPNFCDNPDGCYGQPPDDHCVEVPDDPICDSTTPPMTPPSQYCDLYPDDQWCSGNGPPSPPDEYCMQYPDDVVCSSTAPPEPPPPPSTDFCTQFPNDPMCTLN